MAQNNFLAQIKRRFAHFLISDPLSHGYEVWVRLEKQLPPAVGIKADDELRVEQFSRLVKELSFLDYYALKTWLKYKCETLRQDWNDTEHFSGTIEHHYMKHIQICEEHLEVME